MEEKGKKREKEEEKGATPEGGRSLYVLLFDKEIEQK